MALDRKEYLRNYNRVWIAKRRADWFAANGPCVWCGSWERLEIDHINREEKKANCVWSWRQARREAELKKCRVLCHDCHVERHQAPHGARRRYYAGCRCHECLQCFKRARMIMDANRRKRLFPEVYAEPHALPAIAEYEAQHAEVQR